MTLPVIIFAKILRFASVFNLSVGILFTVTGFCLKNEFKGAKILNQIGFLFSIEAFGIIMILMLIFSIVIGDGIIDKLFSPKWYAVALYIVFAANVIYRLFFNSNIEMENGASATGEKVLAGIALSLILNLTVLIISSNFIRSYK